MLVETPFLNNPTQARLSNTITCTYYKYEFNW